MTHIFLSGGSGFIGRNIREHFINHDIAAPAHTALPLEDEQAVDAFFKKNSFDVIIHTAVKPFHRAALDTSDVLNINLRMHYNLVKQVQNKRAGKMIVTGSGSEYSIENYVPNMSEDYFGTHIPTDDGTLSRYICARQIEDTPLPIYNMRIFGIFGKYEAYEIRFISNAICKFLYGLPITLRQDRAFSYIYIDDFLRILSAFVSGTPKHKAYNIVPTKPVHLHHIAKRICAVGGKPDHPIIVANSGQGTPYTGNNARLMAAFTNTRFTPIDGALADLMAYYKQNLTKIDKSLLLVDK